MDTVYAALHTTAMIFLAVSISFGVYLHQVAKATASAAAVAAANAAVQVLEHSDWNCSDQHAAWPDAVQAGTVAAAARTDDRSAATATQYQMFAEPSCTVLASVTVGVAGVRSWLEASAVACRPARPVGPTGWTLAPPC